MENLAYVGKIIETKPIEGADRIHSAVVVCGKGGKWNTVVPKDLGEGAMVTVFMPDAIVPQLPELAFMEKNHWRVRMCRFKGAPSEALAVPDFVNGHALGEDVTEALGVTKFEKPVPAHLAGDIYGAFPTFIPKTDEIRYQAVPEYIEAIRGQECVATMKIDGSSTTVYKYNGHVGVCSRNWELKDTPNSAQWQLVKKYGLPDQLDDGLAIQFEICGPGIQGNPLGLSEVTGFVFDVYYIPVGRYMKRSWLEFFAQDMEIKLAPAVYKGPFTFSEEDLQFLADSVKYPNGKPAEGVVIRPENGGFVNDKRLSFKVINLNYKD